MELSKLVLMIQFVFGFTCLLIQLYALCSARWAWFESRVELGLIEEHGHFGLWSMCTYRRLMPAEVDENGKLLLLQPDCDPMNTFFTPGHPRAFISFFVVCHTISLMAFCSLCVFRLVEIHHDYWRKHDEIETNPNKAKRLLVIVSRFLTNRIQMQTDHEHYIRNQIRNKLYAISVAILSTMLALAGALTPQQALRETDIFLLSNVTRNNYRVWRGPGFWAQLTTMIMDMLITTLIVIEVRVVFVMFHQQSYPVTPLDSTRETNENSNRQPLEDDDDNGMVNPFFQNNAIFQSSPENHRHHDHPVHATMSPRSVNLEMTVPKSVWPPSPTFVSVGVETDNNIGRIQEFNQSSYVNSEQVRRMKNQKKYPNNIHNQETSYCNPIFREDS